MTTFKMNLLSAAAVALCFSFAPAAQATTFSKYLTMDGPVHHSAIPTQGGGEDRLQDDSLSKFVNVDGSTDQFGNPTYTVGDVIYGMVTLSEIDSSGVLSKSLTTDQVAILFSAKITGSPGGGVLTLAGIGDATNAYDLRKLLDDDASIIAGVDNKTVGVIVSTTKDPVGADDPLNWTLAQFETGFTNANGWYQEAVVGLVETDDFFQFAPGFLPLTGTERGAFTVQKENFIVKDWLPVDVFDFFGTIHKSDVTLDKGEVNVASVDQQTAGWTLADQSTFFVNPIPEPATLGLLGLGLLGMGFSLRKRNAA